MGDACNRLRFLRIAVFRIQGTRMVRAPFNGQGFFVYQEGTSLMLMRPLKLLTESIMNTEPGLTQNAQGKRTTSVRLEHLDTLERIVRDFGFKDRSHFFQLCTDALLQAHRDGHRLDWPPRFVVRE
jgi:hypothetical protein